MHPTTDEDFHTPQVLETPGRQIQSLHGADPREQDSPKCRALVQPRGGEVWGLKPLIVPCVCQPHPCFTPMTWIA